MKNKLIKAIEAGDRLLVKEILIDSTAGIPLKKETLEMISLTLSSMPEIFDEDDGVLYPANKRYWTETLTEKIREDLKDNFSRDKLSLIAEISEDITMRPDAERYEYTEQLARTIEAAHEPYKRRGMPASQILGYVLIALGAVAAIVGLCVSVSFMIGIGIGVFMIGTAVTYMSLRPRKPVEFA
ncbi:MAG: hypothetical protein NC204_02280 [Candidatus Amulumruptor caecigallinarius]|nr:hypothetical protein [Candidatus Amulumruptor caecigallinarius]